MTYEEMQAFVDGLAAKLRHAGLEVTVLEFEPGESPSLMTTYEGTEIALVVELA